MNIQSRKIEDIREYENNPRNNDDAVDAVAKSIAKYGFKVPIVIDKEGIIVTGHTRYKAAKQLGLTEVPCVVADDLNEEQVRAFRLADNMVAEKSEWDFELLLGEFQEINTESGVIGFEAYEIEDIMAQFDAEAAAAFFEPAEQKEKEPSMIQCPCCGKWFEE